MSKPTGILRPLGLALVLAIGFGVVYGLAAGWGISIWEGLRRRSFYENLIIGADGTPLIARQTFDGYQDATFRALDGSEVKPGPRENAVGASLAVTRPGRRDWPMFPLDGNARVRQFSDGQLPPRLWYFLHDGARDGRGYFVGYDSRSKLCLGFIGRDGFRPDQPPLQQWFPVDGAKLASGMMFSQNGTVGFRNYGASGEGPQQVPTWQIPMWKPMWKIDMLSGTELIEVDLRSRSVRTLLQSADLVAVSLLETAFKWKPAEEKSPRGPREELAVRTADRVLLFDASGKQHATFPIPEELRDRTFVFYELDAAHALLNANRQLHDRNLHEELFWIDASGKVLRQEDVSLQGYVQSDETRAWTSALIVPAPAILAFMATVVPLDYRSQGLEPNYSAALAYSLAVFWPALLAATLLAAALAWWCCRRHRRYYQPASGVWFAFVLLTGVPGLVAYLFHRRWPVLEKCPACGQNVPRDREACAKCGAAFPPPEPKGCEVFA